MKLLITLISFFTVINLNTNSTYKTKEQEFIETIHSSYDEYVYYDLDNSVGDLILIVGKVNGKLSCSIYYKNNLSEKYNVNIIDDKKDKEYTLSEYEQYQIYYNIELKEGRKYYINIVGEKSKLSYTKYLIVDESNDFNELELVKGEGNASFPYNTKLKNKLSTFTIYILVGIGFVIFEIIVFIIIKKLKKKNNQNLYINLNYTILDEIEENKDEE